jgi:hypothetical protein
MPTGPGSYGTTLGRPPLKKKKKRAKSKVQTVKERLGGRVTPRKPAVRRRTGRAY